MIDVSEIKWGSYSSFEGPYRRGKIKFEGADLDSPKPLRDMAVITATEGGAYDAFNGYDRCITTLGLVQWCDAAPIRMVTALLSRLLLLSPESFEPLRVFAEERGYILNPHQRRWVHLPSNTLVESQEQQRVQVFGGCSGRKGSWTEEQRETACAWAAALSSVWGSTAAQAIQMSFTAEHLGDFILAPVKSWYDDTTVWDLNEQAVRALYLSYAANNPTIARDAFIRASALTPLNLKRPTREFRAELTRQLVLHSGIAIYPERYNRVRPTIERIYGVDLPDISEEIEDWAKVNRFQRTLTIQDAQLALQRLGYDVGPSGVDGVWGPRSTRALLMFERHEGIPQELSKGVLDGWSTRKLEEALKRENQPSLYSAQ